jgi:GT2 family glycosyltransferase
MTSDPIYAVVLVNYNSGDELARALQSVADELAMLPWQGIVVDNASSDSSTAAVESFSDHVALVRNEVNVGFARGVNQGVSLTSAPYVLILNPDCRLRSGALPILRAVLDAQPECAIVGPRILDPDGSIQGSARGDPDMLTGLFGRTTFLRTLAPFLPAARRNVVVDRALASGATSSVVDWLSGACMLARREALQAVGGFDERFFLYWEDADLCRRLRARGLHVRYVPGAVAVHRVGQSSRTARASAIRAFHESAYLYYVTHVAPARLNPKRAVARAVLNTRCWLQLMAAQFR